MSQNIGLSFFKKRISVNLLTYGDPPRPEPSGAFREAPDHPGGFLVLSGRCMIINKCYLTSGVSLWHLFRMRTARSARGRPWRSWERWAGVDHHMLKESLFKKGQAYMFGKHFRTQIKWDELLERDNLNGEKSNARGKNEAKTKRRRQFQ